MICPRRPVPVEVCVVTYRNEDTVQALVTSLAGVPGASLAVHENGGSARTLELAAATAALHGIPFRGELCGTGNCGFGVACNALAAASTARDLLFLNPDAVVEQWPDGLAAQGRIVGAEVLDEAGRPALVYGTRRRVRDEVALRWLRRSPSPPRGTGYVSGAALLVDRRLFERLGGFDRAYFMYYEDIDLCHRATDLGAPVVVDARWRVSHRGGHSVGRSAEALALALLRSYASGRRFHASRRHPVRAYDLLTLVDAALRSAVFSLVPARHMSARANRAVVRAAASRLLETSPAR